MEAVTTSKSTRRGDIVNDVSKFKHEARILRGSPFLPAATSPSESSSAVRHSLPPPHPPRFRSHTLQWGDPAALAVLLEATIGPEETVDEEEDRCRNPSIPSRISEQQRQLEGEASGFPEPEQRSQPSMPCYYELLLGADIMNYPDSLPSLAETILALSGPGTRVLLATGGDWVDGGEAGEAEGERNQKEPQSRDRKMNEFSARLRSAGFTITNLTATSTAVKQVVEDPRTYGGEEHLTIRGMMTQIIELVQKGKNEDPQGPEKIASRLLRSSKGAARL